jgi:hypothetical protein
MDYENYSNSIYNVNKKKNNGNKKQNFYGKNRNYNRDEEDENILEEDIGFKSAINMVNKKVFNNKNNYNTGRSRKTEEDENYNNGDDADFLENAKNMKNSGGGAPSNTKKFVPANKNNNKGSNKEKEAQLDEKLKGFDPKVINKLFIYFLTY